jgi:hypothetical protein
VTNAEHRKVPARREPNKKNSGWPPLRQPPLSNSNFFEHNRFIRNHEDRDGGNFILLDRFS